MKRKSIVLIFILVLLTSYIYSQNTMKVGLSGSIQGSQFGILVPVWLAEKIVIAPAIEIIYAEKIGTDIGIGIAPRFYINKNKVSPYFGIKAGVYINMPASDNNKAIDYLFGGAFGGEYFVFENLSFGVEIQGNMTKSDENSYRFGNPEGITFNTGTMISATIYF